MQIRADLGQSGHNLQNGRVESPRMAGDKSHPSHAVNGADQFEQIRQGIGFLAGGIAIGVDGLAEQGDLMPRSASFGLFDDLRRRETSGPRTYGTCNRECCCTLALPG